MRKLKLGSRLLFLLQGTESKQREVVRKQALIITESCHEVRRSPFFTTLNFPARFPIVLQYKTPYVK